MVFILLWDKFQETVEKKLEILKSFDVNKMSLNIKKTKFMVFGSRNEIDWDIKIKT